MPPKKVKPFKTLTINLFNVYRFTQLEAADARMHSAVGFDPCLYGVGQHSPGRNRIFMKAHKIKVRVMKGIYSILTIAASVMLLSCNESRRGTDSNVNEPRNEAAAEENKAKFEGKTQRDARFVFETVASNYGEIKLAELANQKSRSEEVKEVAQMILEDHTTALNELKTLAQAKAIEVPVEETESFHNKLENMAEESAEDFDEEWVKAMLDHHDTDIEKFEDRLEDTEDAELKAYINKMLPILKKHRERLEACREAMRNQK